MHAEQWAIEWRGKITRDVGVDYELAETADDARELFTERYPMREIRAVSLASLKRGKIIKRDRIDASPPAGMRQEWTEWQVKVGRKVVIRLGSEDECRKWALENGVQIIQ